MATAKVKKFSTHLIVAAATVASTFVGASITKTSPSGISKCNGNERWIVKTMQDTDAENIDINSNRASTIKNLIQTQKQAGWSTATNNPRLSDEDNVYTVPCKIIYAKLQADGDIHLALQDINDPGATLVAEIPDPNCPNVKQSPFASNFQKVRNDWLNNYQNIWKTTTFQIKGVFFFDKGNHGNGGNANGVELHPILSITKK
jgi:hypothetical protein